jgi:hypothetical protein
MQNRTGVQPQNQMLTMSDTGKFYRHNGLIFKRQQLPFGKGFQVQVKGKFFGPDYCGIPRFEDKKHNIRIGFQIAGECLKYVHFCGIQTIGIRHQFGNPPFVGPSQCLLFLPGTIGGIQKIKGTICQNENDDNSVA